MRHPIPAVNWSHPLNKGLVGWWLTWPGTLGLVWRDLVKAQHGTLTSGPVWFSPRGRQGGLGAVDFDGSDDYVTSTYGGYTALTASFWFYPKRSIDYEVWVDTGSGGSPTNDIRIYTDVAADLVADANGSTLVIGPAVVLNAWNFGLLRRDGAGTSRLCLNGVESSNGANNPAGTAGTLRFGRGHDGFPCQGSMDDIRVWNRALSADEAMAYYRLSRQGYPGLLATTRRVSVKKPAAAAAATAGVTRRLLTSDHMLRRPRVNGGRLIA